MRLVMDRFAARVAGEFGEDVVLKGGVVLELRLAEARATKDLDLRRRGDPDDTLARLQRAARADLHDYLTFEVVPDPRHPTIDVEGRILGDGSLRAVRSPTPTTGEGRTRCGLSSWRRRPGSASGQEGSIGENPDMLSVL